MVVVERVGEGLVRLGLINFLLLVVMHLRDRHPGCLNDSSLLHWLDLHQLLLFGDFLHLFDDLGSGIFANDNSGFGVLIDIIELMQLVSFLVENTGEYDEQDAARPNEEEARNRASLVQHFRDVMLL